MIALCLNCFFFFSQKVGEGEANRKNGSGMLVQALVGYERRCRGFEALTRPFPKAGDLSADVRIKRP